jgi:hypothetical protein
MEIPGRESSPEWQAHSLFSEERTDRTYFFSPWSDYLFGYRDGNMKFIYNATLDDYEVYDLARDPEERFNRIGDYPQTLSANAVLQPVAIGRLGTAPGTPVSAADTRGLKL